MTAQQRLLPQWMSAEIRDSDVDDRKNYVTQKNVLEYGLPFLKFHGSILYSYEVSDCSLLSEDIRINLSERAVIGFDIEWPPAYLKGNVKKVALVQLCVSEEKCYLFHISSMTGFPKGLKMLLEDETIKKTGVGIEGDQWKLMSDFDIKLKGFVELADVANQKLKCKETWSLNGLVKHLFSKQLLKEKAVRCSNWAQFPLSEDQKIYAATDAYAGLLIYQKLEKMSAEEQTLLSFGREMLMQPSELKEQLVSVSQELLDLAANVPDTPASQQSVLRTVDTLTGVLEKLTTLRDMLLNMADLKDKIEATSDPVDADSVSDYEHEWQHDKAIGVEGDGPGLTVTTSCVNKDRKQNGNRGECGLAVKKAEDGGHSFCDSIERICLMSLDITEHELRQLECQSKEGVACEEDCVSPEEPHGMDNDQTHSIIESDEELELEMLKSLQDVDHTKTPSTESGFLGSTESIHETEVDIAVDDEDDEGIEEEEDYDWDPSLPEPNAEQVRCLKMYFGHSRFKPVQWKVIHSVLQERRDNLVVMATGYGKSLCYQFAPVYTGGIGIVISPLISLMEDQVLQLEMSNITACFLGSAQSKNVLKDVKAGFYRVVYMTPEFCSGNVPLLQQLDNIFGITLIAIDEAHCISEWGHDFRSSYRTLGSLKKMLPSVPIVALTATASPSIREDIKRSLTLQNPQVTCTGFDRPNLYLEVGRKTANISQDLQQFLIKKQGSGWEFEGPTIIYCPSRKTSEQVTAELIKFSIACGTYHAGMGIKARREVHHKFMRDEIQCVVATVAFGMGINKPDIRQVIHFGAPKEMESYYQEIGRAGRDGLPSSCSVLWTTADMNINRHLLNEIQSQKFREYKLKMMVKMEKYLSSNHCRRKIILSHFEDKQLRKATSGIMGTEKCCDNCQARMMNNVSTDDAEESLQDFGSQAHQLMSAISTLGEKFGAGVPVLFLRGSNSQRLPDKYRSHSLFGSGKNKAESWWKALARQLITEGFLKETSGYNKFATICGLTEKGRKWLYEARNESRRVLLLQPNEELCSRRLLLPSDSQQSGLQKGQSYQWIAPPTSGQQLLNIRSKTFTAESPVMQKTALRARFSFQEAAKISSRGVFYKSSKIKLPNQPLAIPLEPLESVVSVRERELQTAVYGKLVAARQKLASEKDIPPAVLATNKILVDMAKSRPTTIENMKKIDGVSEAKSSMLAPLLEVIKEFCLSNVLPTVGFPVAELKAEQKVDHQRHAECSILQDSVHITYTLFQEKNMSLREIADSRNLPLTVVGTHLSQALKAGYQFDVQRAGLTPQVRKIVTDVIQNPPINSDLTRLRAIRELVPPDIELYLIRMTVALLEKECNSEPAIQQSATTKDRRQEPSVQTPSSERLPHSSKQAVSEEDVTWIKTEGKSTKTSPYTFKSIFKEEKKKANLFTTPNYSLQNEKTEKVDFQQPSNSSLEEPSTPNPTSISLASWNQPPLDADTEELFMDSQSQSSSPPAKRKLPEWFGASKENRSSLSTSSKKTKMGTKRGLFS